MDVVIFMITYMQKSPSLKSSSIIVSDALSPKLTQYLKQLIITDLVIALHKIIKVNNCIFYIMCGAAAYNAG